jgi:LPS-assembly protein
VKIPLRLYRVTLSVLLALPAFALAQHGLQLQPQRSMLDIGPGELDNTPVYIEADRLQGNSEKELVATGNVRLRKRGQAFFADWMRHDQRENEVTAIGNVRIEQGKDVVLGSRLRYNLNTERGRMENADYSIGSKSTGNIPRLGAPRFTSNDGRGTAERLFFDGPGQIRAQNANYTTCTPGNDDWLVRTGDLRINKDKNEGVARDASVSLLGQTIFYTPYLSFPLSQERTSGLLTPHYGNSSTSGLEFTIPYFWNLAPNRDITFYPRVMSKRGLQLRTDIRYLDASYKGEIRHEILPSDQQSNGTRQAFSLKHTQQFARGWLGSLDINHVSDATYFTDLSTHIALTSQSYLPRQGILSRSGAWGDGGTYNFSAMVQRWQTLQSDPAALLIPPYNRKPQLSLSAQRQNVLYGDFDFIGSYVDFDHPTLATGKRLLVYPSITFPLQNAYAHFTPKIGLHAARYFLNPNTTTEPNQSRVLPIVAAAGGLTFERDANIFGSSFTQTLEPKMYYVYIPYRDQSRLPNFDSGVQDINFATIFSENQFSGHDRINDANQITFGVTTRLLNPATGVEVIRVGAAQRYYFQSQRVTVPGVPGRPDQTSSSDLLAAVSGTVAPHVTADAGWQYNTDLNQTQRLNLAVRYNPKPGKVVNFAYRHTANSIKQFDISGQWPVAPQWNAVGRLNYSTRDRRALESLAGFEYDGGCWGLRVSVHRIATTTRTASTTLLFELELNGLSKTRNNTFDLLSRSIGGYTRFDPRAPRHDEYQVPGL